MPIMNQQIQAAVLASGSPSPGSVPSVRCHNRSNSCFEFPESGNEVQRVGSFAGAGITVCSDAPEEGSLKELSQRQTREK